MDSEAYLGSHDGLVEEPFPVMAIRVVLASL